MVGTNRSPAIGSPVALSTTLSGKYFPTLRFLSLDENYLVDLPLSLGDILSLHELSVDSNRLTSLPQSSTFPKLRRLSAKNNLLADLPDTLKRCSELEEIELSGNPLQTDLRSLVADLPKLLKLCLDAPNPPTEPTGTV